MLIKVVCPNGHELNVNDSFAGKTGLCPLCRVRVTVPALPVAPPLEDAIMNILGPHSPRPAQHAAALASVTSFTRSMPHKKECDKCHKEIEPATHVCPFCHTYIANLANF